ncbi:protein HEXIM1 [Silurus meridionalis]|nr:protein HEXIM1 [Silurus meridionalis]XP_046709366.1 protein HEXIM1 [Silurus meridionalis]
MELSKDEAAPEADDRGGQRVSTEKQVQRNPPEFCPGLVSGDTHPMCRARERGDLEPKAGDAAGDDGDATEETSSKAQGERDPRNKRRSGSGAEGAPDARQGKKKHRRRPSKKKRRWKPYFKLTWEEKKELDERESARASRVRAEMFAKGLPVAPYNTTQFLMEEHDREEPDLNTERCNRRSFGANRSEDTASEEDCFEPDDEEEEEGDGAEGGESDGMGRAAGAGGEFLQRDFSETYERYHVETLQNMSKQELVREYLELEKSMSRLEEENNWLRRARRNPAPAGESAQRVHELERELERLKALNGELLFHCRRAAGPAVNGSAVSEPERVHAEDTDTQ